MKIFKINLKIRPKLNKKNLYRSVNKSALFDKAYYLQLDYKNNVKDYHKTYLAYNYNYKLNYTFKHKLNTKISYNYNLFNKNTKTIYSYEN